MQEQSHDGGALFEFELQQRTDREIEVKHRGTGHVYRFLFRKTAPACRTSIRSCPTLPQPSTRPCSQHRPDGLLSAISVSVDQATARLSASKQDRYLPAATDLGPRHVQKATELTRALVAQLGLHSF